MLLEEFFRSLREKKMLPSRMTLQEEANDLETTLDRLGLRTMQDLVDALKTKSRVEKLANQTGLDKDLLILLRREVMRWLPKPLPLKKLPCLEEEHVKALAGEDIRTTKDLLIRLHEDGITDLADAVSMKPSELRMAAGMVDLGRVNGIGPAFLAMLTRAGFRNLEQFLEHSLGALIEALTLSAEESGEKPPALSEDDTQYCLSYAGNLTPAACS